MSLPPESGLDRKKNLFSFMSYQTMGKRFFKSPGQKKGVSSTCSDKGKKNSSALPIAGEAVLIGDGWTSAQGHRSQLNHPPEW